MKLEFGLGFRVRVSATVFGVSDATEYRPVPSSSLAKPLRERWPRVGGGSYAVYFLKSTCSRWRYLVRGRLS